VLFFLVLVAFFVGIYYCAKYVPGAGVATVVCCGICAGFFKESVHIPGLEGGIGIRREVDRKQ